MFVPARRFAGGRVLACIIAVALVVSVQAVADAESTIQEPVTYLSLNEGSGLHVIDMSGNGISGEIHGATRTQNGACGGALQFNGIRNYVSIPFSSKNHPEKEISVDLWFSVDSYDRQVLISTYYNSGYRIAFDDGNDLWWTVSAGQSGDVSVPVQHEGITPRQWHHVAGTYDGKTVKIYLDGILRNSVNASGSVRYGANNYVMLGVDAGEYNIPDPQCNAYLHGGLDEIRIYDHVLTYGQVMDDRFRCPLEPVALSFDYLTRELPVACSNLSNSLVLGDRETITRKIIMPKPNTDAVWNVRVPPGSMISVNARDAYSQVYPDYWYLEIGDNGNLLTRSIAYPNTTNTPIETVIPSGNATLTVRYFDGVGRFPASVYVDLTCTAPPEVIEEPVLPFFSNPTIVIYTASWATFIALILVIFWLRRRTKRGAD